MEVIADTLQARKLSKYVFFVVNLCEPRVYLKVWNPYKAWGIYMMNLRITRNQFLGVFSFYVYFY